MQYIQVRNRKMVLHVPIAASKLELLASKSNRAFFLGHPVVSMLDDEVHSYSYPWGSRKSSLSLCTFLWWQWGAWVYFYNSGHVRLRSECSPGGPGHWTSQQDTQGGAASARAPQARSAALHSLSPQTELHFAKMIRYHSNESLWCPFNALKIF